MWPDCSPSFYLHYHNSQVIVWLGIPHVARDIVHELGQQCLGAQGPAFFYRGQKALKAIQLLLIVHRLHHPISVKYQSVPWLQWYVCFQILTSSDDAQRKAVPLSKDIRGCRSVIPTDNGLCLT